MLVAGGLTVKHVILMATELWLGPDEMHGRSFGWGGAINWRQSPPKGPQNNSHPVGEYFRDPDFLPDLL